MELRHFASYSLFLSVGFMDLVRVQVQQARVKVLLGHISFIPAGGRESTVRGRAEISACLERTWIPFLALAVWAFPAFQIPRRSSVGLAGGAEHVSMERFALLVYQLLGWQRGVKTKSGQRGKFAS